MFRTLLTALLLTAVASPHLAAKNRKVAFRTLCLGFAGELRSLTLPGAKGAKVEVQLFSDVSPVIEGTFTTADAAFYGGEVPGADGKATREIVAKGPLAKSDRQLFVFLPNAKTGGKEPAYTLHCYDDDLKAFPLGNIRVINLSSKPLRFTLAGKAAPEIKPDGHATLPHSKEVNDYDMYPVVVEFKGTDGNWSRALSVNWKATDRRRDIAVAIDPPQGNEPLVKLFPDDPPWISKSGKR